MRSIKSSECEAKVSPFRSVLKYNIRRFWAVPALMLLTMIICCPVACILVTEPGKDRVEFISSMAANEYFPLSFLYFAMPIAMGLGVFEYIQKSRISNYVHSLPITRDRLFAANYLSGLLLLFIPTVITLVTMIPFGIETAGLFKWMLMAWLNCAVSFSITAFAAVVSGTVFMHLFNSIFFNFVVVMLIGVFNSYASILLYGYESSELMSEIIKNSMPVVALYGIPSVAIILLYVAIWMGMSLLAAFIYRKRAIENTGQSLVFTWTKSLIIGVVTFIGTCYMGVVFNAITSTMGNFRMNLALVIGMVFGFIATFLVISLIVHKGPRIFGRQNLVTAAIVILVTALFAGGMVADVTGYVKKGMDPEKIQEVAVYGITDYYGNRYDPALFASKNRETHLGPYGEQVIVLRDRENIEAACRIKEKITADHGRKRVLAKDDEEYRTISISAKDTSGKNIRRSYSDIDDQSFEEIRGDLAKIFESEEYKEAFSLENLSYGVKGAYITGYKAKREEPSIDTSITTVKAEELLKAMEKDQTSLTLEEMEKCHALVEASKPYQDYYAVSLNLKDSEETDIGIYVTKDQPNAWKWIKENVDK